ncbi:ABC transporter permease [uncultured Amnibacterium sp.]|uniref:ABC transporter permease n=1 Tax=uncultured Amnibacterium sp. TaxID=1631851 RepID=UPI0035CBEAE7
MSATRTDARTGLDAPVAAAAEPGAALISGRPPASARRRVRALLRRPTFVVSAIVIVWWVGAAILWPVFGLDPFGNSGAALASPGPSHPFGTDALGRSILARTLAGADSALVVGPFGSLLATAIGTALGLLAGYFRGWVDTVLMRLFDVLVVLPPLILLIVVAGAFGTSTPALVLIVGFVFAPGIARIIRAAVLAEMGKTYVTTAALQGERHWRILLGELLPNVLPTVIIQATLSLASAIFVTASLSFLGLGAQPPSPDWGLQINENRIYLQTAPWTVVAPALAVATLVVAVHLIADNIKEVWR